MRAALSYGENETIRQYDGTEKGLKRANLKQRKPALGQRGTDKARLGRI